MHRDAPALDARQYVKNDQCIRKEVSVMELGSRVPHHDGRFPESQYPSGNLGSMVHVRGFVIEKQNHSDVCRSLTLASACPHPGRAAPHTPGSSVSLFMSVGLAY